MLEEPTIPQALHTSATELTILVDFFDVCRYARTMTEVNLAAGVARQELLDLAEDACDHLSELFGTPARNGS